MVIIKKKGKTNGKNYEATGIFINFIAKQKQGGFKGQSKVK
jgi:hypothetical protein